MNTVPTTPLTIRTNLVIPGAPKKERYERYYTNMMPPINLNNSGAFDEMNSILLHTIDESGYETPTDEASRTVPFNAPPKYKK